MAEMISALESAGLARTEARIYLFLLQHGASSQSEITRRVQLHRRTVYDVLDRLAEKGLVSIVVKNNRRVFDAVKPERLKEMLDERARALDEALPKLGALQSSRAAEESVKVFTGKNGLKSVFEDQIAEGKPLLIMGASPLAHSMMKYYFKSFDRRRIERGIKARIVLDKGAKEKFKRVPLAEVRYIPEEIGSVAATNVYGSKVAIIMWNECSPFAVLIESKPVADSYRKLFEAVWARARR